MVSRSPNRERAEATGPGPRTRTRLVVLEAGTENDEVVKAAPVRLGPTGIAAGCGATATGCGATATGCGATAIGCGATIIIGCEAVGTACM